jgi:hypothetical protein
MGYLLQTNGLTEEEDKVAALKACAAEMHKRGLDGPSPPRIDATASPAKILKSWRAAYGDDATAGTAFLKFFTK